MKDPMLDVDLVVAADAKALARGWMGATTLEGAMREGALELTGTRALVRAFPGWFLRSPFADVPRRG